MKASYHLPGLDYQSLKPKYPGLQVFLQSNPTLYYFVRKPIPDFRAAKFHKSPLPELLSFLYPEVHVQQQHLLPEAPCLQPLPELS